MKIRVLTTIMACVLLLSLSALSFAATSQTINVKATVPTVSGSLSIGISKVTVGTGGAADTWLGGQTEVNFGSLIRDTTNHIFTTGNPGFYYAVDVAVADNTGTVWTLTHDGTSIASGTNNLDANTNVTFVKVTGSGTNTTETVLSDGAVSYAAAISGSGKYYTKTTLSGGWLRIYYGIGTGNPAKPDNAGVTTISENTPAGAYAGVVTLTLTP